MLKSCAHHGTIYPANGACPRCPKRNGSNRAWRQKRLRILKRDSYRCQLQLEGCTVEATQVDHRIPVIQGGQDIDSNLYASCASCNLTKGAR